MGFLSNIIGTHSEREVKRILPIVDKIEALEPDMEKLSDEQLRAKTDEFKERLSKGETLDDLLVEAYAVVREASKRTIGLRHFRVQLIGGVILHQGRITEMRTGEGKTLVSTLPAYLNALEGKGVHIVTVNDYLAKRVWTMMPDARLMAAILPMRPTTSWDLTISEITWSSTKSSSSRENCTMRSWMRLTRFSLMRRERL